MASIDYKAPYEQSLIENEKVKDENEKLKQEDIATTKWVIDTLKATGEWTIEDDDVIDTLEAHSDSVTSLAIYNDRLYSASDSVQGVGIKVWSIYQ